MPLRSQQALAPLIRRSTEARGTYPQHSSHLHHLSIISGDCYSDARGFGQDPDPLEVTMTYFLSIKLITH